MLRERIIREREKINKFDCDIIIDTDGERVIVADERGNDEVFLIPRRGTLLGAPKGAYDEKYKCSVYDLSEFDLPQNFFAGIPECQDYAIIKGVTC